MITFIKMFGFNNIHDFLGIDITQHSLNKLLILSTYSGIIMTFLQNFIQDYSGISLLWMVFIIAASVFDVVFGLIVNVLFLKIPYESSKMIRGIFKMFVVIILIFLTGTFLKGVENTNIKSETVQDIIYYIISIIHYTVTTLISLFILLGISENGAKLNMPIFTSLTKMFKVKIKKIENNISDLGENNNNYTNEESIDESYE